jgi:hypothetical protein
MSTLVSSARARRRQVHREIMSGIAVTTMPVISEARIAPARGTSGSVQPRKRTDSGVLFWRAKTATAADRMATRM